MNKIAILFAFLLIPFAAAEAKEKHDLSAVLDRLDSVIAASPKYVAEKQERIARLKSDLKAAQDSLSRYNIRMRLYEEYRSYKNDSAISVLQDNLRLARSIKRQDFANDCLSLIAYQCSTSSHYPEAQTLLGQVDLTQLKGKGYFYYYRAQNHLYSEIGFYSPVKAIRDSSYVISHRYETLLLQSLDKRSSEYKEYLCRRLFSEGKLKEAQKVCDEWLKMTPDTMRNFSFVAFYQYLIHIGLHDDNTAIWWAVRSSICDITHGVMDQGSLWPVAEYVSKTDISRSNRYINFAWQCATVFGTGVRTMQISPVLSTISSQYQRQLDSANHRLLIITIVIALLAVTLFVMLYYTMRQRRRLAEARNDLHQRNEQLTESNAKLHESDHIKEVYIGRFLSLCSDYIERMDKARKETNRMIKAHKIDDLFQMTRSTEQKDKEVEELYGYFDSTFLNIFPSFVEDFNALLKPECRIKAEPGKLNATLRIFALIRLGIDDSRKIAAFLHYSIHTIYNYRATTRSNCIGDKDKFEDEVKKLGKIQ